MVLFVLTALQSSIDLDCQESYSLSGGLAWQNIGHEWSLLYAYDSYMIIALDGIPVVPHKAVAEVSKIGNL